MNLSYILPFYQKAELFRLMLPVNDCYRQPDVEVVCVLDDPAEENDVLGIVKSNPDIKFRVIVNDWKHDWRPPCIPYNVGIRHALAGHVVLTDPESAIVLPRNDHLLQLVTEDFRCCYGGITWIGDDFKLGDPAALIRQKIMVTEATCSPWSLLIGLLVAPKLALERICGFDERRTGYGWDDTDLRIRLCRLGYRWCVAGTVKIFHAMHDNAPHRVESNEPMSPNIMLQDQKESWGKAFCRVAWDWNKPV